MCELAKLWRLEVELMDSIDFFERGLKSFNDDDEKFDHYNLALKTLDEKRESVRSRRLELDSKYLQQDC